MRPPRQGLRRAWCCWRRLRRPSCPREVHLRIGRRDGVLHVRLVLLMRHPPLKSVVGGIVRHPHPPPVLVDGEPGLAVRGVPQPLRTGRELRRVVGRGFGGRGIREVDEDHGNPDRSRRPLEDGEVRVVSFVGPARVCRAAHSPTGCSGPWRPGRARCRGAGRAAAGPPRASAAPPETHAAYRACPVPTAHRRAPYATYIPYARPKLSPSHVRTPFP